MKNNLSDVNGQCKNVFLYLDENDFNKKKRSLRKYCPIAYKELLFRTRHEIVNMTDGTYKRALKISEEFKFIYGQIKLVYSVKKGIVTILDIQPSQFLIDGYTSELKTYKGIFYRDKRDMFKIDLLMSMKVVS